ncbi:MAG: hypothetical protein IPF95_00765 [Flavobacteriales bacterium]|nr:hypothetical protein [Flavobacteriales bacterium]MBK6946487.1 hypothetical protein [Flavobacteriales bacterium]MBK9536538.1 hypothetical protein [Flavobacteriales bacterium]
MEQQNFLRLSFKWLQAQARSIMEHTAPTCLVALSLESSLVRKVTLTFLDN